MSLFDEVKKTIETGTESSSTSDPIIDDCQPEIYTVEKGDSLWAIAEEIYGDGTQWTRIYEANQNVIGSNPNLIQPNQKLVIPGIGDTDFTDINDNNYDCGWEQTNQQLKEPVLTGTLPDEIDTDYPNYNPYSSSYEEPHAPKPEYNDPISPSDVISDVGSTIENLVDDGIGVIDDWF
jgi:LysM repeat protein